MPSRSRFHSTLRSGYFASKMACSPEERQSPSTADDSTGGKMQKKGHEKNSPSTAAEVAVVPSLKPAEHASLSLPILPPTG